MSTPKISVIVPVYNVEKYLRRCIDSILAQTFADFELLLIDDGSKDSSGAICDEYAEKDNRILVFHKENGGVSSARNVGLDNAKGEWITFVDADDYVSKEWLYYFKFKDNTDTAMICQGLVKFIQNGDDINDTSVTETYRCNCIGGVSCVLTAIFLRSMLGWIVVKAFRRDLIKKRSVKFDISQRYREDEKFILEYLNPADKIISYDVIGYNYFVPDTAKYADWDCTPEFARCIYNNVKRLEFEKGCVFRNYFANEYKTVLLKYFSKKKSNTKQYIIDLSQLTKEEYDNLFINPALKFIMRYDFSGFLSEVAIRMYLFLRK